jgi:four helix bundle protein
MKRTAVSIPSNIAEGAARLSNKEFLRFLYVALGSFSELETQCIIARKLGFFQNAKLFEDIETIRKRLINFIKYLKSKK